MIPSKKKITNLITEALDNFTPQQTLKLANKIEAADAMINSQVGPALPYVTQGRIVWEKWININNWANYFANRWKYHIKEMRHMLAFNAALRSGYIFGDSGIWNNNGTPEVITISHYDANYAYFTLSPSDFKSQRERILNYHPDEKPKTGLLKRPKEQVIHYQFDSLGYGAIMILDPILKLEQYIQKGLFNEALSLPTRLIRTTQNKATSTQTVKDFIELLSPIINRVGDSAERYDGIRIDTNTETFLNLIEASKNWYYDILGRRTNSDFKLSHTLEQEAQNSAANVDAIEWDRWIYFKKFAQDYARLFGVSVLIENFNGRLGDCFSELEIEEHNEQEISADDDRYNH